MHNRPEIRDLLNYLNEHGEELDGYLVHLCRDVCFLADQLDEANADMFAQLYGGH